MALETLTPLAEWIEGRGQNSSARLLVEPGDDVRVLANDIDRIDLIVVNFPTFKDGRGFSSARLLREQLGYQGEMRATGHLIRDQLLFLDRCGFDGLFAQEGDWDGAVAEFSVWFQPTGDGRPAAPRARHAGRVAAAAE